MESEAVHDTLANAITQSFLRKKAKQIVRHAGFSRSDLPDIQQELALSLLTHLPDFDARRGTLNTFIYRVVNSKVRMILRDRKRLCRGPASLRPLPECVACNRESPCAQIDLRDLIDTVSAGIDPVALRVWHLVSQGGQMHAAQVTSLSRHAVREILKQVHDRVLREIHPDFRHGTHRRHK